MSARLPNDEEKAIARVFMRAGALLAQSSPLAEQFAKAATARLCAKPGVPNEAELLERAHAVIRVAE